MSMTTPQHVLSMGHPGAAPAGPLSPMPYYLGDKYMCGPISNMVGGGLQQANAGPLGLSAFALTTFVLSCYNAGLLGVSSSGPVNVVLGLALFYGGLAQGLAGMWEFRAGNTFAATAFTSYGAFWLAYAVLLIPAFGVAAAYKEASAQEDLAPAVGTFLLAWSIFTLLMLACSLRTSAALVALFAALSLTFALLMAAELRHSPSMHRAGGFTGIVTALIAWYNAVAGILAADANGPLFTLPVGKLGLLASPKQ